MMSRVSLPAGNADWLPVKEAQGPDSESFWWRRLVPRKELNCHRPGLLKKKRKKKKKKKKKKSEKTGQHLNI